MPKPKQPPPKIIPPFDLPPTAPDGEFQVILLDVGQGDSTLIVYPDGSLTLVDCGSIKNSAEVRALVKDVIYEFAWANGNKVNNVVLTHPDQDHYNLIPAIFPEDNSGPEVDWVYIGGREDSYVTEKSDATYKFLLQMKKDGKLGYPPHQFTADFDYKLSRAGVTVSIVAANASGDPEDGDPNQNSIVLWLMYQGCTAWLMGDADQYVELSIVRWANQKGRMALRPDGTTVNAKDYLFGTKSSPYAGRLLKLGHHGSDTASSENFVKAVNPTVVGISADTKTFGIYARGMPSYTVMQEVMSWSNLAVYDSTTGFTAMPHWFLYFDTRPDPDPFFRQSTATELAVCSTLYEIEYAQDSEGFEATGGAWYFSIFATGDISGTIVPGWTGDAPTKAQLLGLNNTDPMPEEDEGDGEEGAIEEGDEEAVTSRPAEAIADLAGGVE